MNYINLAYALNKLTETARQQASDNMIKSYAPNASELCADKVDFAGVMRDISVSGRTNPNASHTADELDKIIKQNTNQTSVSTSRREASIELSQMALMNLTTMRLLSHAYKEQRSVIDNFRVS